MQSFSTLVVVAVCLLLLFLLIKIIKAPFKLLGKLILNMVVGLVTLFVFNFIGALFDFTLPVNALNALVAGILGIPGVILLALVKVFL